MNLMRSVSATLVLWSLGLLVVGSAGAVPKPPPKFWSPARCERVLLAHDHALPTAEGNYFHAGQTICVGTGGPHACTWTSDHRSRLYSEFNVFTRARYIGGIVRSFTLATRASPGLAKIVHHYGDAYVGWPADFFMGHVRLLATHVTPAHFRSIVAPIAARLMQQETISCTSG